jgi:O-antigen/teichoic acid export membrane protein
VTSWNDGGAVRVTARQSARSYAASVAGSYALLALSFGISICLTRTLGAEGFGRLTLFMTVVHTGAIFAGFWTHAGFLRYGVERLAIDGSLRRVLWARSLVVMPTVAALLSAGWIWRREIAGFHGVAAAGFATFALYVLVLFVGQTFQLVLQARGAAGTFALLQAGERGLVLAGLLIVIALGAPDLGIVVALYVVAGVALCLASLRWLQSRDFVPIETDAPTVQRFLAFSWPLIIAVFGNYFSSNWIDAAIIRHFLGSEGVGQYALAYQLMGAVQQVPMSAFPVIMPLLVGAYVRDRDASIRLYLDRAVPHAVFAMVVVLCLGVVIGPPLVAMVFGPGFTETTRALPPMLFAVGWYCVFIAYIPILNLREQTRPIVAATLAAAVGNVVALFTLVPSLGVVGAAWATVASQAASALAVSAVARRGYGFALGPVLTTLSPLALLVIVVSVDSAVGTAVAVLIAAALLVLTAWWQRLASPPDRRLLAALDLPVFRRVFTTPAPSKTS